MIDPTLFIEALLETHEGGGYIRSDQGNSQMISETPELFVPPISAAPLTTLSPGLLPVFVTEDGQYHTGLDRYLVELRGGVPYVLVDNHNAVAHAWGVAWSLGLIRTPTLLVHVDQHSDLWANAQEAPSLSSHRMTDWWRYAYYQCSVANYISPLLRSGYLREVIRIEGSYDLEIKIPMIHQQSEPYILNIDLDFWAEELSYIPRDQSMSLVASLLAGASLITIATSPAFISYDRASEALRELLAQSA